MFIKFKIPNQSFLKSHHIHSIKRNPSMNPQRVTASFNNCTEGVKPQIPGGLSQSYLLFMNRSGNAVRRILQGEETRGRSARGVFVKLTWALIGSSATETAKWLSRGIIGGIRQQRAVEIESMGQGNCPEVQI